MRIADHQRHAFDGRQFLGSALGVAAGDQNAAPADGRDGVCRTVWRTSSSAVAVTVQVFSTTKSASCRSAVDARPFAASPASIAAPSACEARHPKFLTRKRSTVVSILFRCRFTRRAALKTAGAFVAGAVLLARRLRAANPPSPVIVKLGNYMSEAAPARFPTR